jgi:hypothetical protein
VSFRTWLASSVFFAFALAWRRSADLFLASASMRHSASACCDLSVVFSVSAAVLAVLAASRSDAIPTHLEFVWWRDSRVEASTRRGVGIWGLEFWVQDLGVRS